MFGIKILETAESPYNGEIKVIKTIEGTRIVVGGLSQSGWLVKRVWKEALKKIKKIRPSLQDVLLLGLGGGSAMELVDEYWPESRKTGVDIDDKIVNMGKKYLHTDEIKNLTIKIADASLWVERNIGKNKYDLILVDLYKGGQIPEKFTNVAFMKNIKRLLKPEGLAAFNHLYSWEEKADADIFEQNLRQVFSAKTHVLPEANIIFICYS